MNQLFKSSGLHCLGIFVLAAALVNTVAANEEADELFERNMRALIESRSNVQPVNDTRFAGAPTARFQQRVQQLQAERRKFVAITPGARKAAPKAKSSKKKKHKRGRFGKGKKKR